MQTGKRNKGEGGRREEWDTAEEATEENYERGGWELIFDIICVEWTIVMYDYIDKIKQCNKVTFVK